MFVFLIIIKKQKNTCLHKIKKLGDLIYINSTFINKKYLPKRATSAFGDWIKVDRLLSGALESQYFYFFKLSEK